MNPYDIDFEKLPVSEVITNKSELLKVKLIAKIYELTSHLSAKEGAKATGLKLLTYRRIMVSDNRAISLDEAIEALEKLGHTIDTKPPGAKPPGAR